MNKKKASKKTPPKNSKKILIFVFVAIVIACAAYIGVNVAQNHGEEKKHDHVDFFSKYADELVISSTDDRFINEKAAKANLPERYSDKNMQQYVRYLLGLKAPDFTVTNLANETITLSELKGQNVIIELLTASCESCASAYSFMSKYIKTNPDVKVLQIFPIDNAEAIQAFLEKYGFEPNADLYAGNSNTPIMDLYKVTFTPIVFFVDKNGYIQDLLVGTGAEIGFEEALDIAFNP